MKKLLCTVLILAALPAAALEFNFPMPDFETGSRAAALMVLWDLSLDPLRATVENRWIWISGGSYFGVPLGNFVGWFMVTWLRDAPLSRALRRKLRCPRSSWVSWRNAQAFLQASSTFCRLHARPRSARSSVKTPRFAN